MNDHKQWLFTICVFALLLSATPCLQTVSAQSPPTPTPPTVETWVMQGFCVGAAVNNETQGGTLLMANVISLDSGGYRMFYNKSSLGNDQIRYADSPDGVNWTTKSTVLQGSSTPTDRTYMLGGASVVKLPDKRFRMYYRCSVYVAQGSPPKYHVRSAISDDGVHFTEEAGIRIDIFPYDSNSQFILVGHGSFFLAANGTYVGIVSANLRDEERNPSDLFVTTSSDGLTWGNFKRLYSGVHDPTVVKKGNQYHLYAMYLHYYHGKAVSSDGINWPSQMNKVSLVDSSGEEVQNQGVGDLGAALDSSGEIRLYTNHGNPSSKIAYFKQKATAGLKINGAAVQGKKLFVYGEDFKEGAALLLNGQKQKTANDESSASTTLVAKKAGKLIAVGQTVTLQVQNPDGLASEAYLFTRAPQ
jgi:hypothetical protein